MNKIRTIISKEWGEVFKNRFVLFTVAFLPLIMTAIPLIMLFLTRSDQVLDEFNTEMPAQFNALCPEGLNSNECVQVYMVSNFMVMFMILPLAIPATIAAYSIVGEKVTRSLEPLLATPITTSELLIGKSLAAALPAILATWAGFALFAVGAWLMISSKQVFYAVIEPYWLLAIFLVGPLMALLSVNVSVIVSSRTNDPRVAEQISMIVILPLMLVFFGQLAGLFILNSQLILLSAVALIILDALLVRLAVHLFQRETILTRWK